MRQPVRQAVLHALCLSLRQPLRLASASLILLAASACATPPAAPLAAPPAAAPAATATGSSAAPAAPAARPAAASPTAAASTDTLWQQIQAASASNSCDNDSQCHTIGVGAKACGGPERYLPWSSQQGDGAELKRLVDQHATARRAADARDGMMSTCSVVADPGASCRANRCTLNPASAFGNRPNAQ